MKRYIICLILLIATSMNFLQASQALRNRNRADALGIQNMYHEEEGVSLFDQMRQMYAIENTKEEKARFISSILDRTEGILEEKIKYVQTIAQVINAEISANTGWLYDDNPALTSWLKEQKNKINHKLSELQWQAHSFGYKTAVLAAKYTTIYLGIILAAYVAQDQYMKITGEKTKLDYGTLAWLPIEKLLELAKNAVVVATGPTTQKMVGSVAAGTLAAGKTAADLVLQAGNSISKNLSAYTQKEVHGAAVAMEKASNPKSGTWGSWGTEKPKKEDPHFSIKPQPVQTANSIASKIAPQPPVTPFISTTKEGPLALNPSALVKKPYNAAVELNNWWAEVVADFTTQGDINEAKSKLMQAKKDANKATFEYQEAEFKHDIHKEKLAAALKEREKIIKEKRKDYWK